MLINVHKIYIINTGPLSVQAQYSRLCPLSSSFCYNGNLVTWSQSQSHIATDDQSVSKSWYRAPFCCSWPNIYYSSTDTVLFLWGALSDESMGLAFVYILRTRQLYLVAVSLSTDFCNVKVGFQNPLKWAITPKIIWIILGLTENKFLCLALGSREYNPCCKYSRQESSLLRRFYSHVLIFEKSRSVSIATGNWLDDRGVSVRVLVIWKKNFFLHDQTGSGVHPASYPKVTGCSFPGGKAIGAWNCPLISN
jgi:hypothetical protein